MKVPKSEEAQNSSPLIVRIVSDVQSACESLLDNIKHCSLIFGCYAFQHVFFDVLFLELHV